MRKLFLAIAVLLPWLASGQPSTRTFTKEVANLSALQALDPLDIHKSVFVRDRNRGGLFYLTNNVSGTNAGIKLISTANALYAWQRVFTGSIDVRWFGADPTGVSDSKTAFQDAANLSTASATQEIAAPAGSYLITGTVNITNDWTQIVGDGRHTTTITFVPTSANQPCFKFQRSDSSVFYGGAIKDIHFSGNNTHDKIGIELGDTSGFIIENVSSNPWTSTAGASKMIRLRGREFTIINFPYLNADIPISIEANVNNPAVGTDHLRMENLYLTSTSTNHHLIKVQDGVIISNVSIDGAALVGGLGAFTWNDTGSATASIAVDFRNIRVEGLLGANTNYAFFIKAASAGLANLTFDNIYGASTNNGYYLDRVNRVVFQNVNYPNAAQTAIKLTNGVSMSVRQSSFAPGGNADLGNLVLVSALNRPNTGSPIDDNAEYGLPDPNTPVKFVGSTASTAISVPALSFYGRSSGTPANGLGTILNWFTDTSTTDDVLTGVFGMRWANATHANRTSDVIVSNVYQGTLVEGLRIGTTFVMSTQGTNRWYIDTNGDLLASTDNVWSIGGSANNRPQHIRFVSSATGAQFKADATGLVYWNGRTLMSSPADGTLLLQNNNANDFTKIQVKSTSGQIIQWGTGSPESAVTAPVGSIFLRTDGGAVTTLYVKESGTGTTGWVAK